MFFGLLILVCLRFSCVTAILLNVSKNAWFQPNEGVTELMRITVVTSLDQCICKCYNNLQCSLGCFYAMNMTCVLYSASIWQGQLRLSSDSLSNTVFSFVSRTHQPEPNLVPSIIEWLFDGDFNDVYNQYNGTLMVQNSIVSGVPSNIWVGPGYAGYGSAVYFDVNMYAFINKSLDLTQTSFTLSAWIWIAVEFLPEPEEWFVLFALCNADDTKQCLLSTIRNGYININSSNFNIVSDAQLHSNIWYHVAYVYDRNLSVARIYLNGYANGQQSTFTVSTGDRTQITIGAAPSFPEMNLKKVYIDKLTFVSYVKDNSQILDEATLVAYYPFDGSFNDSGPNRINNISSSMPMFDPFGRFNQSYIIDNIYSIGFQASGFYYLGQSDYPYSFSLWIYVYRNNGTILGVRSNDIGSVPMIGFNLFGFLTIQTLSKYGYYSITSNMSITLNKWIHIAMTYSFDNGIRLYINGLLVNNNSPFVDYAASGQTYSIFLGTSLLSNSRNANETNIPLSGFRGKIDELKIYSRELSANEISIMAAPF